jgi:hypothetical protein
MKTPNDEMFYSAEYYAHMRPGSHHYIMFGVKATSPTAPVPAAVRSATRK